MQDFDKEQAELLAQLEVIRAKKKALELEKPVEIRMRRLAGAYVFITNTYRADILEELHATPGRQWREYDKENAIPVGNLAAFLERVQKRPNVTIAYNKDVDTAIHDYLYAPAYTVSLESKGIHIKMNHQASSWPFQGVPGFSYNPEKKFFNIPLSEGWRFNEIISKGTIEGVVYTDDARDFILKQVENRLRLDAVALSEDAPEYTNIPGLHGVTLRPFQRVGVKFFNLNGGSGLLADEMGLGKTLQAIAFSLVNNFRSLVICPASLKVNWTREILKFTDEKPYILQGTIPSNYDIAFIIANKPKFVIINYDIIGRSIDIDTEYKDTEGHTHKKRETKFPWIEVLNICGFDVAYLDEAHYIKNIDSGRSSGCRKLKIPRVIGITGTPVLNRPGEYWPILYLAAPETFPSYERFVNQYTYDKKTARNVDELRSLLKPLMIRRKKSEVVKELPAINRMDDAHELTTKARMLVDRIMAGIMDKLPELGQNPADRPAAIQNILVQIMRLKQVCAIDKVPGTCDLATRILDSSQEGEPEKKVLLFSQFKPVAYAMKQMLGNEAIGFVRRTGNGFVTADAKLQQELIDEFQNNPAVKFLIVTEKTAKEGHNITKAQAVIFNDPFWTPAAHQQAEGRAYGRLSDLHPIDSYYRVATDSIDEWIQELLLAKLHMIDQVVEGVNADRAVNDSIVTELLQKMKEGMWTKGK